MRESAEREMKILHILYESRGDYFGIGGVGTRAYEIYSRLKHKHDITLLCKKYPGAEDAGIDGLRHIFVGAESKSLTKTLLSYACASADFVRRHGNEFDIIIEDFSPAIPTFLPLFSKRPIVLQVQGYTESLYFRKYNPFYALTLYMLEKLRPRFYKNFIFISQETAHKLSFNPMGNTAVIPNGIDSKLLETTPQEGDYMLYYGRVDIYGKGLDTLLQAYKEFCGKSHGIRLVIAGDGRDMQKFNAMLLNLPDVIRKKIEFAGWIDGDMKKDILKGAISAVFPSRHETQGIAVLEAMACGRPVIVSNIPELEYAVKCGGGISFKTGDAASLADAMIKMVHSKEHVEMGMKGREFVRDLTWDRIALRFEEFLEGIASGDRR